jgi:hypothetical protein
MKPRFGAQTPKQYSEFKWDRDEYLWQTACAWTQRTGKPPKSFEEYHPIVALALLIYPFPDSEEDSDEETTIHNPRGRFGPPNLSGEKLDYDEAQTTGDPTVDAWEQAISEGRTPDW